MYTSYDSGLSLSSIFSTSFVYGNIISSQTNAYSAISTGVDRFINTLSISPFAKIIYQHLIKQCLRRQRDDVTISFKSIARNLNCSHMTAQRAIKQLQLVGLIKKVTSTVNNIRQTNLYKLTVSVAHAKLIESLQVVRKVVKNTSTKIRRGYEHFVQDLNKLVYVKGTASQKRQAESQKQPKDTNFFSNCFRSLGRNRPKME